MDTLTISDAMYSGMWTIVLCAMPVLLVAMSVGLLVGIIQTATSIQEQTLSFIPKILAVMAAIAIFGPWIFQMIGSYAVGLFTNLFKYVG